MFDIENLNDIKKRIRDTREDKDIKQKDLARDARIATTSLNKIERGKQSPTIEQIAWIANALDVEIEYILGIDKDTDFIDDFIDLFVRLTTTKEYFANNSGILRGEDLIFSTEKDYLVLTGNDCVFTLIKEIAAIKNLKETLSPTEYKNRLNAAKDKYKKSKSDVLEESKDKTDEKSYFLISGEQMTEIIEQAVKSDMFVKKLLRGMDVTSLELFDEQPIHSLKLNVQTKDEQK